MHIIIHHVSYGYDLQNQRINGGENDSYKREYVFRKLGTSMLRYKADKMAKEAPNLDNNNLTGNVSREEGKCLIQLPCCHRWQKYWDTWESSGGQ